MKLKKFAGFGLTLVMIMSSMNLTFAGELSVDDEVVVNDEVVSGESLTVEITEPTGEDSVQILNYADTEEITYANKDFVTEFNFINAVTDMPIVQETGFISDISNVSESAIVITSAEELANIKSGNYILGCDIDLSTYNNGEWETIFIDNDLELDGQGYTIFNLYQPNVDNAYSGLICSNYTKNTLHIKNLNLQIREINSQAYSGGIVSRAGTAIIQNCSISGEINSGTYAGGFVGYAENINIEDSCSNVEINNNGSNSTYSGGLVGYAGNIYINKSCSTSIITTITVGTGGMATNASGGLIGYASGGIFGEGSRNISNSYFSGSISAIGSQNVYVGGICGYINGQIINTASFGSIVGTSHGANRFGEVGGIVGRLSGYDNEINNSYVNAYVESKGNSESAGGIVGYTADVLVINSYSEGNVKSSTAAGGLIGYLMSGSGDHQYRIVNSHSLANIEGSCVGGLIGNNYSYDAPEGSLRTIIEDCYSLGRLTGIYTSSHIGGIVGSCRNSVIIVLGGSISFKNANSAVGNGQIEYVGNISVVGSDNSRFELPSTKTYSVGTETGLTDCLIATLTPHTNDWSDIVWTSSNTDVAEIVSPRLGISGVTSDCLFCDLNCKSVGTSVITVTNSKGASASCLVVVNEGNSTTATNSPTYGVSSKPASNSGKTVEEQLKSAIDEYETALYVYEQNLVKAMENKQVSEVSDDDIYQSMKTRIAGMVSVPAAAQEACYHAIYETIKDMSFSKTAFDKIDMSKDEITVSTSVIKQITKAFASEEREYDYGMYKIKVNVIGFNGANFGMLTYTQKNKVSTPVTVGFTTNATEMAQIMSDYLNQINQMEVNALNEALNATIDYFVQSVGIDKYIKSKFTKIIDKYAPQLNNLGLGEVVSFVSDCKNVCKQVDKISKTDMSDYASVYDEIKALTNLSTSETSKISTTITKKAYSNLRNCRAKLINAATNYIADTPEPSLWDKITSLKCPVDVIVYDENGTEIGSIIGDEITCNSSDIMLKKTGDIKEIYTSNGIEVSFKIIATDYGLLNITVEDYIDNTVVGRQNFYNIPLDIDDEFITSAISSEIENMTVYTADGDRIDDEYIVSSSEAGVNISVAASENGTVYNAGEYVKGDGVNLKAVPNDGYKFAGWYNDDTLLSTNLFYNFTATEDISLTAKFVEDNSDAEDILIGDITGDGTVDRTDLLRLNKYFAGIDVDINTEATDVTGDGNINRSDLLRLNKFFAGQD